MAKFKQIYDTDVEPESNIDFIRFVVLGLLVKDVQVFHK